MSSDSENSGDIRVPAEKMNEFFFMDNDEEQQNYGATTNIPDALNKNVLKDASQAKVSTCRPTASLSCLIKVVHAGQQAETDHGL